MRVALEATFHSSCHAHYRLLQSIEVGTCVIAKFIYDDTFKDKFEVLDVRGNLKLSILANIFSLSGHAKYLTEEKKSSKSVKVSMSYAIQTQVQWVNILSDRVGHYINQAVLNDSEATHVVTGILWGSNLVCSFEHHLNEGETRSEIQGALSSLCNFVKFGIEAGGQIQKENRQSSNSISVTAEFFGDIVPRSGPFPTTAEETIQLMRSVPELARQANGGKGSVMKYMLVPIEKVREKVGLVARINPVVRTIKSELVDEVESIFDTIVENRLLLKESLNHILEHRQYISKIYEERIEAVLKRFNLEQRRFKRDLTDFVRDFQAGNVSEDGLHELIEEFQLGDCTSAKVNKVIEDYQPLLRQISFIQRCGKAGIKFISRTEDILDLLSCVDTDVTFVLVIPESINYTMIEQSDEWHIFQLLKEDNKTATFVVHDVSISPANSQSMDLSELSIFKYYGRKGSNEDAFKESILYPSIRLSDIESVTRKEREGLAGYVLKMPCPLSHDGECPSKALEWVCSKCENVVQYEYNEVVYCRCGKASLMNCAFRCNSPAHGYQYKALHALSIQSICEKALPREKINILLLGETGVGKSTFINAFANYLRHDSLADAMRGKMETLIHSSFELGGTTVTAGIPDKNERPLKGQSSTQKCRSYVFSLDEDTTIRLIDTPGIGDTRGVKQDRINFEGIMDYISVYEKIHGICILLKPNESRLTPTFQFCIDELLLHLHKNAAANIVFAFTNSRSTLYQSGDTMVPLREYLDTLQRNNWVRIPLEPNTLFYFDSESFRLCAALKQGLKFDDITINAYSGSWDKSVDESRRLIKRIMDLTPHDTRETVALDYARRSIILLSEPMVKINEDITVKLNTIEKLKLEAKANKITVDELESKLECTYTDLEPVHLERPRTVCTSEGCTTICNNTVLYTTHCHEICSLQNVEIKVTNCVALASCYAMSNGICRVCGCPWQKHMHVTTVYVQVKKTREDTAVKKELEEMNTKTKKMNSAIDKANQRIKDLESERETILESLKIFASFLLQNAILVQNNGILAYIDLSIENQDRVAEATGDYSIVESLRAQRKEFEAQMEIIKRAIEDGVPKEERVTPMQVMESVEKLCSLKINGPAFEKIRNWAKRQREMDHADQETPFYAESRGSKSWLYWLMTKSQSYKGKRKGGSLISSVPLIQKIGYH
ncbi:hypothetical protein BGW41_003241 [Actinomortierella wolfii]|nr:hypothetical protein BGW41_003241 [Actinomortierella wolfii]